MKRKLLFRTPDENLPNHPGGQGSSEPLAKGAAVQPKHPNIEVMFWVGPHH